MASILKIYNTLTLVHSDIKIFVQGHIRSLFKPDSDHNIYYLLLSNIEPKKIINSCLISYILATSVQIIYSNISEVTFLNFSIYIFWWLLSQIDILCTFVIKYIITFGSMLIVYFTNPIYSLLTLIFVFFNMILVLLYLKIEFLSMILLIIYIGAISILFLFVIMLFNLKKIYNSSSTNHLSTIDCLIFAYLIGILFDMFENYVNCLFLDYNFDNESFVYLKFLTDSLIYFEDIMAIGASMYTTTGEIFLALGYILLTAMVGAIIMALSTIKQTRIIDIRQ